MLNADQRQRAAKAIREYLDAPTAEGASVAARHEAYSLLRRNLIATMLAPLMNDFLRAEVPFGEFKRRLDGANKRNNLWGFRANQGQLFFNMLAKAGNPAECELELRRASVVPRLDDEAERKIQVFEGYVRRVGTEHARVAGSRHGCPRVSSIPYFLSYFWQVQAPDQWPIYYTTSVRALDRLGLWRPAIDLGTRYVQFRGAFAELAELFAQESGRSAGPYDVEYAFWHLEGNPLK